ncbi:Alginate lyase [Opitutaceae bacterium TAV5]|nr:Alginate lyase [Opitutaceae bacterium TAV5]
MTLRHALLFIAALTAFLPLQAAKPSPGPVLINLDYDDLIAIREDLRSHPDTSPARHACARLLAEADAVLPKKAPSVLDKQLVAPSGDKHDFFAIGNYSWPNPETSDGLPYIRRDGQRNPEARGPKYDKGAWDANARDITTLCLAWFYSGNEKYAAKATTLLRTWFTDPSTRMNPNLNYAASQPGVHDGHYIGIIEGVALSKLIDYVQLLTLSESWTSADNTSLQSWFREFRIWLLESPFGKREREMGNNHGIWYATQVATCSIYIGETSDLAPVYERARRHIAKQIASDGSLPAELKRTRSLMYTRYTLQAFIALARCGELTGHDIWHYKTPEGRGVESAFNFAAPYLSGAKEWTWPRMGDKPDYPTSTEILRWPAKVYRTPALLGAIRMIDPVAGQNKPLDGSLPDPANRMLWLLGKNPSW